MRLVAEFDDEKQAFAFFSFLRQQGIQASYEASLNPTTKKKSFHLWIVEEEDLPRAIAFYQEFQKNPSDPRFKRAEEPFLSIPPSKQGQHWKIRMKRAPPPQARFTLINFILALCLFFWLWNWQEESKIEKDHGKWVAEMVLTPPEKWILFDYPVFSKNLDLFLTEHKLNSPDDLKTLPAADQACFEKVITYPTWKGAVDLVVDPKATPWKEIPPGTLFGSIREGEVWRLFAPCLFHREFFHLFFNLGWIWLLGKQIEDRLGKGKTLLMILLTGIISNIAQYLMSGPYFFGFSGVVLGMAGFIWMRQKMSPWEGYPLTRGTAVFLLVYVIAMAGLEVASLTLQFFHLVELSANIANTAHIAGGLSGMLLAKIPFFSRGRPS